jgi:DNA-binding NtrC family response regulator
MKTYLIQNDDYPLDASLMDALNSMSIGFKALLLPTNHNDIAPLLNDLEGGMVIFPAVWEDLFCVKIIREISPMPTPFEMVMIDEKPDISNLIVAFNEGLSAYLETPVTEEKLQLTISRIRPRFEDKIAQLSTAQRLSGLASQSIPFNQSQAISIRNQYLGKAFIDIVKKTGPLFEGEVNVLLVSSSPVQQKQLEILLKTIRISVTKTGNIEEAIQMVSGKEFAIVISDGFLPDGDAIMLANRLRKTSKSMPHIIVWSSSPEKTSTFLKPENHIDEVLSKPGPETGIESILPSIIAVIYRT